MSRGRIEWLTVHGIPSIKAEDLFLLGTKDPFWVAAEDISSTKSGLSATSCPIIKGVGNTKDWVKSQTQQVENRKSSEFLDYRHVARKI